MPNVRLWSLGFTFAAVLATGTPVFADPVEITSGFLTVSGAQDFNSRGFRRSIFYDLSTDPFRLVGNEPDGIVQNIFEPRLVTPSLWTPTGGVAQLVAVSSALSFSATPATSPTAFQVGGTVTLVDPSSGAVLFSSDVFGSGIATWQFVPTFGGQPTVSAVTYEFNDLAAVPEPSTMLLLGTGLAGLAARRKRKVATARNFRADPGSNLL
jgi:hypothetical protein